MQNTQSYLSVDLLVMPAALHQSAVLHVPSNRQSVSLPFLFPVYDKPSIRLSHRFPESPLGMSLQSIADALNLNPIKVRKLLITAGVYESKVAEKVQDTFEGYRETQDYKTSILSTAKALNLSKASVTSYLPYKKGVYYPSTEKEKISVGAERQRRYRAMKRWRADPT